MHLDLEARRSALSEATGSIRGFPDTSKLSVLTQANHFSFEEANIVQGKRNQAKTVERSEKGEPNHV